MIRARIEEMKAESRLAQAPCRSWDWRRKAKTRAVLLYPVPDISERLRDADDAAKRAWFYAFDLRITYDKTPSITGISQTVTIMLRLEKCEIDATSLHGSMLHEQLDLQE